MKKIVSILLLTILLAFTTACPKAEQNARDTAAALGGSLKAAQAQEQANCVANPALAVCDLINRGVAAQNALITASEQYCGWSTVAPPDPLAKCVPVKSYQSAMVIATANAAQFVAELKGVLK